MKKILYYLYLCDNGTLLTPARMNNVPSVTKYRLIAEENHRVTQDGINLYDEILIPESELPQWYEVPVKGKIN